MKAKKKKERIAVLTSGGDAPGMNAALRAIVRCAHARGIRPIGVRHGYQGLIQNDFLDMGPRAVSNIIQRGGTILKTSRCKEFETAAGLRKAKENLERAGIDGLIVIGGDGTYRGAIDLGKIWKGPITGVPGTIDNDLDGTDDTVGYATAVDTALEAIDKLRDTAESHDRFFVLEVMGREAGFIALSAGIAGGAEEIFVPEVRQDLRRVARRLAEARKRGKTSSIVVVAEGCQGGAGEVAEKLQAYTGFEYRLTILGHVQRGGSPKVQDRILGTELGAYAFEKLLEDKSGAAGKIRGELVLVPFPLTLKKKKLSSFLMGLVPHLST
ncbi:MAG TPA: 6-phosphofructokinase [Verrucomicrobiae bacterium]|nr:6-phosphofructokinase [Verrucomicrobiae bacterium]